MSLALKLPMTLAEFLVWEEQQPLRYEFDGTAPVAMTGGSTGHASIRANLAAALLNRLRGSPCRFYGADFKLQVASGHIRYADGMVVSHPVDRSATLIGDPVVVLEVLSPSAAREDRIVKAREYQATPSVQCYVMLDQDGISATVLTRSGETWTHAILVTGSTLASPEIGVFLPLAEVYEGLRFDDADAGAEG